MKKTKNLVAAFASAALATSMVCAAPAMAQSTAPVSSEMQSTYTTMAKAKKVSLKIGETKTLKVTGAKVTKWTTSKKSVVTVSKKGVITGIKAGKATITAKTKKGSSKFSITVTDPRSATLQSLYETITSEGAERPGDYEVEYVLSLSEDVDAIYEEENQCFLLIYKVDSYKFTIEMDYHPEDLGSFVFDADGKQYYAGVKMASYKFGALEWYGKATPSAEEAAALSDVIAPASVYTIGKALYDKLGIQLNDMGFSSLSSF